VKENKMNQRQFRSKSPINNPRNANNTNNANTNVFNFSKNKNTYGNQAKQEQLPTKRYQNYDRPWTTHQKTQSGSQGMDTAFSLNLKDRYSSVKEKDYSLERKAKEIMSRKRGDGQNTMTTQVPSYQRSTTTAREKSRDISDKKLSRQKDNQLRATRKDTPKSAIADRNNIRL
jgi:hypothetical protein